MPTYFALRDCLDATVPDDESSRVGGSMKRVLAMSDLFIDIGEVLLTNA